MEPLIQKHFAGLGDLFEDFQYIEVVPVSRGGNRYPNEPGWYPLIGLPGSYLPGACLYVKPLSHIAQAAATRMTNSAIGSFRAIQSAYWRKQGLLPVFVTDAHHIASPLLAFVPFTEHERFNHG